MHFAFTWEQVLKGASNRPHRGEFLGSAIPNRERKSARIGNYAIHADDDASGETHGKARKLGSMDVKCKVTLGLLQRVSN